MLDPFGTTIFDAPQYIGPPATQTLGPLPGGGSGGNPIETSGGQIGPRPGGGSGGPPIETTGNRWRGRLKHGRGIPPGQARRGGNAWQQWQLSNRGFEPGWRQKLRAMQQGGMQSMNGGGYQGGGDQMGQGMANIELDPRAAQAGYSIRDRQVFQNGQPAQFGGSPTFGQAPVAAPPIPQGMYQNDGFFADASRLAGQVNNTGSGYQYGSDGIGLVPGDWQSIFYGQPSYPQRYTPMIPNEQYQAAPQFVGRQSFDPFSGPF